MWIYYHNILSEFRETEDIEPIVVGQAKMLLHITTIIICLLHLYNVLLIGIMC
jgi:hypothetical protein